ncbi:unnamed protein product [Blepharisma stoltei]|uniref:RNase III domain-containing protein n=1 Tax=Blepharisma stoltei TaxID=1481888 RepID=A0AAU9IBZ3_9CILI|nr:unnamed protein product [Blepharisma stoltei]
MEVPSISKKLKSTLPQDSKSYRNFSSILSQTFSPEENKNIGFLYRIRSAPDFGVILPFQPFPIPDQLLDPLGILRFSFQSLNDLRDFQHEFWTDIIRTSKAKEGEISSANYLIVPLVDNAINWVTIFLLLEKEKSIKVNDLTPAQRENMIVKSLKGKNTTWQCISCFDDSMDSKEFLQILLGSDNPDLQDLIDLYDSYSAIDVLLDDRLNIDSLSDFKKLFFSGAIKSISTDNIFIFANQTKSARHIDNPVNAGEMEKQKISEKGTPVLHASLVDVYPLKASTWLQCGNLLSALVELESASYIWEFAQTFGYKGCFKYLKDACTNPYLDSKNNYDYLQILGNSILKVVSTIHVYFRYPKKNEYQLSISRFKNISSPNLSSAGWKFELQRFLKTNSLKISKFRPPFYASKMISGETWDVEHKITDKMMADFVEALIGALYLGNGIYDAAQFIYDLEILIKDSAYEDTMKLLSNDNFTILDLRRIFSLPGNQLKLGELLPILYDPTIKKIEIIESSLDYYFSNKNLLSQALTHYSSDPIRNYNRFEFLGNSIIDFTVLSELFVFGQFTPEELTTFRHILVSNNFLRKLAISTGLDKHIHVKDELKTEIIRFVANSRWEDDLLNFDPHCDNPPKILSDCLEALIGAIFIDCESLTTTCEIIENLFSDPIMYLVKNKDKCQKNICEKLVEYGSRRGKSIEYQEIIEKKAVKILIFSNGELYIEKQGRIPWFVKKQAAVEAYDKLRREEGEISESI